MAANQIFLALLDNLGTVILAQITDMCLRERGTDQIGHPLVCLLFCHQATLIHLVEIEMCCSPQSTQLSVCHTSNRQFRAGMDTHIGVARWIVLTDIKHSALVIVLIYPIRTAINHGCTTIVAPHCTCIKSLSFFLFVFHDCSPPLEKKRPEDLQKNNTEPSAGVFLSHPALTLYVI